MNMASFITVDDILLPNTCVVNPLLTTRDYKNMLFICNNKINARMTK